jgi:hypothetical protein
MVTAEITENATVIADYRLLLKNHPPRKGVEASREDGLTTMRACTA